MLVNLTETVETGLERPAFLADIRTMTDSGLVFETGGHPKDILRLTRRLAPAARVVIPHYPVLNIASADDDAYTKPMRELGQRPVLPSS